MTRPCPSDDEGFTLIEAMVSFSIFAVVSAAAALSLLTGIRTDNDTTDRVAAAQLAQLATDQARAMPKARLVASPNETVRRTVGGKTYSIKRTVSYPGSECLPQNAVPALDDTSVRTIAVRVEVRPQGDANRVIAVNSVIAC